MRRNGSLMRPFLTVLAGCLLLAAGALAASQGAAYVGSGKCAECHEEVVKAFRGNIHTKTAYYGEKDGGCESCHGPGGAHAESGDPAMIINPAKAGAERVAEGCLACHAKSKDFLFWKGSIHDAQQVGCASCHRIHGGERRLLAKKGEGDLCFSCHQEVRAATLRRSRHPLRDSSPGGEGPMSCSSCHNPHGARSERLISAKSVNDKCYECHTEKKAPVLWEHSPVKEDCLTCHTAHGSTNDKLLVEKVPRLCQQCHMQGRHQTGTLGPGSVFALNRSCLNCHPMVHGSNNPSGPVLQR